MSTTITLGMALDEARKNIGGGYRLSPFLSGFNLQRYGSRAAEDRGSGWCLDSPLSPYWGR